MTYLFLNAAAPDALFDQDQIRRRNKTGFS